MASFPIKAFYADYMISVFETNDIFKRNSFEEFRNICPESACCLNAYTHGTFDDQVSIRFVFCTQSLQHKVLYLHYFSDVRELIDLLELPFEKEHE